MIDCQWLFEFSSYFSESEAKMDNNSYISEMRRYEQVRAET